MAMKPSEELPHDYLRLPNGNSVWLAGDGSVQVHNEDHFQLKKYWPLGKKELAFWREVRDQLTIALAEEQEEIQELGVPELGSPKEEAP